MIIAISGKAGSGKSTIGDIFEKHNFRLDSFATSVKDICSILFNFDREKIEGRNLIHQDIWIKTLFDRYERNKDKKV
jgi:pantothenate kinase